MQASFQGTVGAQPAPTGSIAAQAASPRPTTNGIIANAQIRESARIAVVQAIDELEAMEGQGLERLLTDEYLIPELRKIVVLLELQTDAVDEILAAKRSIEHAVGILVKAKDVLAKGSTYALSGVVGNAAFELAKVLTGLS